MFEGAWAENKAVLPLNCALNSNLKKTPASKAKSALLKAAGGASSDQRNTKKTATLAAEAPPPEARDGDLCHSCWKSALVTLMPVCVLILI